MNINQVSFCSVLIMIKFNCEHLRFLKYAWFKNCLCFCSFCMSPGKMFAFTHCDEESMWYTLNMNIQ